jgi:integrase
MSVKRDPKRRTWTVVVDARPVEGRRQQLRRRGFATKRLAEEAEAQIIAERAAGTYRKPSNATVGEYLEGWLETRRHDLRPTTWTGYRKVIATKIRPQLGHIRLVDLDTGTVESWYRHLLGAGGLGGRSLSPKTVSNAAGVLAAALSDAVRLRAIRASPCSEARLPRRDRPEMNAWTAEEAREFLAAVKDHRLAPIWRLFLSTGLRRGEACGLRWQDVDLANATLSVVETRVVADRVEVGPPKTRAGTRTIALDGGTVEALRAWRARQATERLAAGPAWRDLGLVVVDELGRAPHPENVTRWWRDAIALTGARAIRLHDCRHSAASMALRAGTPVKVVSQRLGHSHIGVTLALYTHVTPQDDRDVADTVGRVLG